MVQANELRIGNWIADENNHYFQVDEIRHWYYSDAEPIPLTPEILEACGFVKGCPYTKDRGFTSPDNNFFFENNDKFFPQEQSSGQVFGIELEYLHQLQNLYFALTGEELKVNL